MIIDVLKRDLDPVYLDSVRNGNRIIIPVVVLGKAVNILLCGERFPNRLRNEAYLELRGLISLADEVIPIPEESLDTDEHIISNEERLSREFQIRFKNPRRINRHA